MGGTLIVPGSHLRRINESDTGRYQNLLGQTRLTCPAGTVVLLHHGIWHGGRRNDSDTDRYMFKIRFNPTVPPGAAVEHRRPGRPGGPRELAHAFPLVRAAPPAGWRSYNRIKLWRALTGDDRFDIDYWVTRVPTARSAVAARTQQAARRDRSPAPCASRFWSCTWPRPRSTPVVGWSRYDGTGATRPTTGDSDEPPYETGLAALQDGWRLFQAAQLIPPYPGTSTTSSFLKHEFFFEKLV